MRRSMIVFMGIIAVSAGFLASCNTSGEEGRTVMVVSQINEGGPVFSDVLDQGDTVFSVVGPIFPYFGQDDFVREDVILVTFFNRPRSNLVTTGIDLPFSDFLITNYRVDWRAVDGAAAVPASFEGALSTRVPTSEEVSAAIVLVPFEFKQVPPLRDYAYQIPFVSFPSELRTIATITFTGHEVGTERDQEFVAEVTVNFGDPLVVSENLDP